MFRNFAIASLVAAATVISLGATQTAHAQFYNGYRYEGYAPRNFDDYVNDRLRQRRIQQATGAPYYPYLDRWSSYYDQQRLRTEVYRPYYEGRQFRYNRPVVPDYRYGTPYYGSGYYGGSGYYDYDRGFRIYGR